MAGLSVRVAPQHRVHLGVALGRYWAWGVDRGTSTGIRLPFLQLCVVHLRGPIRVRVTYMGWRGADHAPAPIFREWRA